MKRWKKWSKAVIPLAVTMVVASSPLQAFAYTGGDRGLEKDHTQLTKQFKRFAEENTLKSSYQKVKEQAAVSDTTYIVNYKEKLSLQEHRNAGATLVKSYPKLGYDVVKVSAKSKLAATLKAYEKMKKVSSVTPSVMYTKSGAVDPKINDMYHLKQLNISKAQELAGENRVRVAVIDSGVDPNHPELKDRIVDSVNIVDPMRKPVADLHGTHVAGIIAAEKGNGLGGKGINPGTEILAIDVFNGDWGAYDFAIADGIMYAVDNGAQVINMSLGSFYPSKIIEDAVNYAIASDVVVVAAAGNSASDHKGYPASYKGVISVGSTNENKELSWYSSFGESIDVVAPGEDIYSTAYTGKSTFMHLSGTSMASPVVAGVASLLLAKNPELTPYEVEYLLKATAEDLGEKGFDTTFGHGLVNPVEAVAKSDSDIPEFPGVYEDEILDAAKKLTFKTEKITTRGAITKSYQQDYYKIDVKEGEFIQSDLQSSKNYDYGLVYKFYPENEENWVDSFSVNYAKSGETEGYLYEVFMDGTLVIGVEDVNANADPDKNSTYTLSLEKSSELKEDSNSSETPVMVESLPYKSEGEHYLTGDFGDQDYFVFEVEEMQTIRTKISGIPSIDSSLSVSIIDEEYEEEYMMDYSNYNGPGQGETLVFEAMPGYKYKVEVSSMPDYYDYFFGMWFDGPGSFSSHVPFNIEIEGKVLPQDRDSFPYGIYEDEEEVMEKQVSIKEYAAKRLERKDSDITPLFEEDEEYFEEMEDYLWETAIPYELGAKESEYMQYADDIDLFKFEVESDGIYHLEINGSDEMMPFMQLLEYNEFWGWSTVQFNWGMMGLENYIQAGLKGGNRYILAVMNEQYRPTFEPYHLESKMILEGSNDENEYNDTEEYATLLDDEAVSGSFDITNDVDMFYLEPGEENELYAFYVDVEKKFNKKDYPVDYKMTPIDPVVFIVEDTNGNQMIDEEEYGTIRAVDRGWDFEGESGSFHRKADAGYFVVLMNYMWDMNKVPVSSYELLVGAVNSQDEDKDSVVKNNIPSKPLSLKKRNDSEWEATGYLNYVPNGQDTDWYKVPAWKNSELEITFDVPSDIDGKVQLFDKKGKLVGESSYYGKGDSEVLVVTGKEAGPYYLALSSTDGNPSLKPYHVSVKASMVPNEGNKERISGATRYETSIAFTNRISDHSLDYVLLANGQNYPDALSGVVLNEVLNGTVLLVNDKDHVQKQALEEAKRLLKKDGKVIILGGEQAVSPKVESTFKKQFEVERIAGKNRTETSIAIAKRVAKNPEEIIVVSGLDFADALSIAPYATDNQLPILLNASKTTLSKELEDYIKNNKVKSVTVIGGPAAVSDDAIKKIKAAGAKAVTRVAGENRYLTSVEVAKKYYPEASAVGISSGKVFPDALSGSHFAAKNNMPVVLVNGTAMREELKQYLKNAKVQDYYIYGGPAVVSENIVK